MKHINFNFFILLPIAILFHSLAFFIHINDFLHAYLDDALFIPILMGVSLWIQRKWILKNPKFTFKWYYACWVWMYSFIVFELIFPQLNSAFTRDIWDGLAYAVGAIYFQLLINKAPVNLPPSK